MGAWTEIGPRVLLVDSVIGDYTYLMDEVNIHYTEMGKFCSIASHACINPGNHPMWRVTQHHITYRSGSYDIDTGSELDEEIFNWRKSKRAKIGNDVIRKLEAIAWWNWPKEAIAAGLEDMKNMELFFEKYS